MLVLVVVCEEMLGGAGIGVEVMVARVTFAALEFATAG